MHGTQSTHFSDHERAQDYLLINRIRRSKKGMGRRAVVDVQQSLAPDNVKSQAIPMMEFIVFACSIFIALLNIFGVIKSSSQGREIINAEEGTTSGALPAC
jgi:hypothetical protein